MAQFVDKVAVMYAGRLMELSNVRDMSLIPTSLCSGPHPQFAHLENKGVFNRIPGMAPALLQLPGLRLSSTLFTCYGNLSIQRPHPAPYP